jgi:hypothetical protein
MFFSETCELHVASQTPVTPLPGESNAFCIIAPVLSNVEQDPEYNWRSLSYFGEIMVNTIDIMEEVIVCLPPSALKGATNMDYIPDLFLKYMHLWSEMTKKPIKFVDSDEWSFADNITAVYICGFTDKQIFSDIYSKVNLSKAAKKRKIVIVPPRTWHVQKLDHVCPFENTKVGQKFLSDGCFDKSFKATNYNAVVNSKVDPKTVVPFLSNVGIFFQKTAVNPISCTDKDTDLQYRGPNPEVFVVDKTHKPFMPNWHKPVKEGSTTIRTLLEMVPEVILDIEKVKVLYRGYMSDAKNSVFAWKEAVVFEINLAHEKDHSQIDPEMQKLIKKYIENTAASHEISCTMQPGFSKDSSTPGSSEVITDFAAFVKSIDAEKLEGFKTKMESCNFKTDTFTSSDLKNWTDKQRLKENSDIKNFCDGMVKRMVPRKNYSI